MMRAAQHIVNGSLVLALGVTLIVGAVLGRSSMVTAQSLGQGTPDPTYFPATGYRITAPAIFDYFLKRGGVSTFGYPVSNDFPLLGHRVQIFQRQVLELRADGTVTAINLLEPDVLPIRRIDGLTLPAIDLDLLANAPQPDDPEYLAKAIAFVSGYVPDQWEGVQLNFFNTYMNTVSCPDAFGPDPAACDLTQLPVFALEVWGLPTSLPTPDPINSEFVYQRFQRGVMHFSRATGLTQGLLVGDWFKRVLIGLNLSPEIGAEVRNSRFFGQYSPTRPLGLTRPEDLPDSSLVRAFRSDTLSIAQQEIPTLAPTQAAIATSQAMTATAQAATQAPIDTAVALTATALTLTQTPAQGGQPTPTPQAPVSDIPVTNEGCLGDEQMWFVPRRPNIGTRAEISVTSRRHHDIRFLRLVGPLDAGTPVERLGVFGFTWTWSVVPAVEAFHEWTFYADGLRPCMTSGFNVNAPLGATATPTVSPEPTNTPEPTTPTPTPLPAAPAITSLNPTSGNCGQSVRIGGTNFGPSQAEVSGNVFFDGPQGQTSDNILSWSNTLIIARVPTDLLRNETYTVVVTHSGGASTQTTFTYRTSNNTTCATPVP